MNSDSHGNRGQLQDRHNQHNETDEERSIGTQGGRRIVSSTSRFPVRVPAAPNQAADMEEHAESTDPLAAASSKRIKLSDGAHAASAKSMSRAN